MQNRAFISKGLCSVLAVERSKRLLQAVPLTSVGCLEPSLESSILSEDLLHGLGVTLGMGHAETSQEGLGYLAVA